MKECLSDSLSRSVHSTMASMEDNAASPQAHPDYQALIATGLEQRVAGQLTEIFSSGKLCLNDLDERALDAIKEFPVDCALAVLKQFVDSNLEHVSNKSAFLCGVMKTYRQKARSGLVSLSAGVGGSSGSSVSTRGPDEEKVNAILKRTGFTLDVTTGQRKYGGPPPNWEGPAPGTGCEVFCGKIPKDLFEDELIPLFERCGPIWDLRLMMDPLTGMNRGYSFVTYTNRESAQEAVRQLDDHEIRPGKSLKVNVSIPNLRLFVGNIPKSKGKVEIKEEFSKYTSGLSDVIIYSAPDDKRKNRGFCFLEYESHKAASLAKRRLGTGRFKAWNCDILVDWADPQDEPDQEIMSKVKVLYVRNLTQEFTEEKLKETFEEYGPVERVKKIKDYAFVHFEERDHAVKAMNGMDGKSSGTVVLEVSLAKPPSDRKKKEEVLRARERRMMQMFMQRGGFFPPTPVPVGRGRGGGNGMRGLLQRPAPDYDYDCAGYDPYHRTGYGDAYVDQYYRNYFQDFAYDHPLSGGNRSRGGGTTTEGPRGYRRTGPSYGQRGAQGGRKESSLKGGEASQQQGGSHGDLERRDEAVSRADGGSPDQGGNRDSESRHTHQGTGGSRGYRGPWPLGYNTGTDVWYRDDSFGATWN